MCRRISQRALATGAGTYLRLLFLHQDPAHLLAPIAGGLQIPFPYAAVAAATAATGRLLRRLAKRQASVRQLRTEIGNPLARLKSTVGQQGVGIVIHLAGGALRLAREVIACAEV
jgi:hypothetical protein